MTIELLSSMNIHGLNYYKKLLSVYSRSSAHSKDAPAVLWVKCSWLGGRNLPSVISDYTKCSSESCTRQLQFYKFCYGSICTVHLLLRLSFPQHPQYSYWINDTNSTPKILPDYSHSIPFYTEEDHNCLIKIKPLHFKQ